MSHRTSNGLDTRKSSKTILNGYRETILNVHGTAPFRLVREAAPYFRVKDGEPRSIVMISSTSGTHGNAGQANYSMGKAGVVGLAKVSCLPGI